MALTLSGLWGHLSFQDTAYGALLTFLIYYLGHAVYALYIHPLSRYPGPKLAAVSLIPQIAYEIRGQQHSWVKALHDKYGEVVHISPNALVYRAPQAWKDIYGHKKGGQKTFVKAP